MSLRHALLGLLDVRPMGPAELVDTIISTVGEIWDADAAEVRRCVAELLTTGAIETGPGPGGDVHRLTDAGRHELRAWLDAPLPNHTPRDPFLVRLFLIGDQGPAAARALVEERLAQAQEQVDRLDQLHAVYAEVDAVTGRSG